MDRKCTFHLQNPFYFIKRALHSIWKALVSMCVAVCCSVLQCVAVRCHLQSPCFYVRCSALQCVAVRCSVLPSAKPLSLSIFIYPVNIHPLSNGALRYCRIDNTTKKTSKRQSIWIWNLNFWHSHPTPPHPLWTVRATQLPHRQRARKWWQKNTFCPVKRSPRRKLQSRSRSWQRLGFARENSGLRKLFSRRSLQCWERRAPKSLTPFSPRVETRLFRLSHGSLLPRLELRYDTFVGVMAESFVT